MDISDINRILGSHYSTIESFEQNATWEKDLKGKTINAYLVKKYPSKIDWVYFSRHYKLSEDFISEFQDKVSWRDISIYQKLSEQFIEDNIERLDFESIIINQDVSITFIEKYNEKILWKDITRTIVNKNNEKEIIFLLNKYKKFLDWNTI